VITFAVVGHNEATLLPNALRQAHEASRPGEPVWFVDSASTDGSGEVAGSLGAEVVRAPLGKGRAVSAAIARCRTRYICLLDADVESTTRNTPATLREALERSRADMVVGEFEWPEKSFRPVTTAIWDPLTRALFPEAAAAIARVPLSGFRVLDVELARNGLPDGFGLEVHLNIVGTLGGRRTETVDIGRYSGPVRSNPDLPAEIAAAILDIAQREGRLAGSARSQWEEWLAPVLELVAATDPSDPARRTMLIDAAARPLPDTGIVPTG
jgi:glycosyltransferase involved in cell wall biosynthesis